MHLSYYILIELKNIVSANQILIVWQTLCVLSIESFYYTKIVLRLLFYSSINNTTCNMVI